MYGVYGVYGVYRCVYVCVLHYITRRTSGVCAGGGSSSPLIDRVHNEKVGMSEEESGPDDCERHEREQLFLRD